MLYLASGCGPVPITLASKGLSLTAGVQPFPVKQEAAQVGVVTPPACTRAADNLEATSQPPRASEKGGWELEPEGKVPVQPGARAAWESEGRLHNSPGAQGRPSWERRASSVLARVSASAVPALPVPSWEGRGKEGPGHCRPRLRRRCSEGLTEGLGSLPSLLRGARLSSLTPFSLQPPAAGTLCLPD